MNRDDLAILDEGAAELGFSLSNDQLASFGRYQELLISWNRRLNLTTVDDAAGIQKRHFLDSLTCATVTGDLNGQRLVDVGSGAGFPGLPLKILFDSLELTLIESVAKKARFLEAVVESLGLSGVQVLAERAEAIAHQPQHRQGYDWAVARAVASLPVLLEYLLPFCRLGGRALAQKGGGVAHEVKKAQNALKVLGGGPASLHPVVLPGVLDQGYLVVVEKIAPTPVDYPRSSGRPAKRPL